MQRPIPYPKCHPSGQAFVKFEGRFRYFGKYGTPQADLNYWAWRAELAGHPAPHKAKGGCLVSDMFERYRSEHSNMDDKVKSRLKVLFEALGAQGSLSSNEYGPLAFQEHRKRLLASGTRCARQVNDLMQFVQRIFRWGVSKQLATLDTWMALKTVERLKPQDSPKQTTRRKPVPASIVAATLPHLSPHCADMVRLIVATGARPGEILSLRAEEVVKEYQARPGWWYAEKTKHKTSNRGKKRWVEFPPEVHQLLLARWPADGGWFFPGTFDLRHFRVSSLRQHVGHVCKANGIEPFSPHQLRHLRLTQIAGECGLDEAKRIAGHGNENTTLMYVHEPPRKAP